MPVVVASLGDVRRSVRIDGAIAPAARVAPFHGLAEALLRDAAGGVCAFLNLPPGATTVTIESKTNFLGAVRDGTVTARSRPLHVGKTTIVVETDVLDASSRRVARTMQTQAVLTAE